MLVTMSDKEIHRLPVIQAVCEKRLRRRDAASQLGISERQAQRLINRYRVSGAEGLCTQPALLLARIFRSSLDVSGDLSKLVHI